MDQKTLIKHSKFISLVLRHQPEKAGLKLDEAGWAPVADLLAGMQRRGRGISLVELQEVVAGNDKKRFAFNDDKTCIRASQGHSVAVDLGYHATPPPAELFHGTIAKFLESIQLKGLDKRARHHVHLSADRQTATKVALRRGKAVILTVDAAAMHAAGHDFFVTANGVWLTENVPPQFIQFPQ